MLRSKRQADPSYNSLSPFLMSIYRPSIEDHDDMIDGHWRDIAAAPAMDRFAKVDVLRRLNKRGTNTLLVGASDLCCRKSCSWNDLTRFCD